MDNERLPGLRPDFIMVEEALNHGALTNSNLLNQLNQINSLAQNFSNTSLSPQVTQTIEAYMSQEYPGATVSITVTQGHINIQIQPPPNSYVVFTITPSKIKKSLFEWVKIDEQ